MTFTFISLESDMYWIGIKRLNKNLACVCLWVALLLPTVAVSEIGTLSEATEACLECHSSVSPGIVADWKRSRHARVTVEEALLKPELERRVAPSGLSDEMRGVVVGCAECHTLFPDKHEDSYEHNDYTIHTVVSPVDCAVCHSVEWEEYQDNIMSYAHINLTENELYLDMMNSTNGVGHFANGTLHTTEPDDITNAASCLSCHGTRVTVDSFVTRDTDFGEMQFPVLSGWPNQGVGRINPDGSIGSCTACHARHQFSIELARKPNTCSQCHKGPDVPAFQVYQVSKHGNMYSALGDDWNFDAVPWRIGTDFTAPTCATCHISLLVDEDGSVVARRTHRMNDRLDQRIFGLIYAHPYPISPNTTIITNKAGLPLPTELTGEPVAEFLIGKEEQSERRERMKTICKSCHSSNWVEGHFNMLDITVETTNAMTLTATEIMSQIWELGFAEGLSQGGSIFDEAIEKKWVEQWLFYANSTRFAAAMAGADYGVFANGRWSMAKNLAEIHDWLVLHQRISK